MNRTFRYAALLFALLFAAPAEAHELLRSSSSWRVATDDVRAVVTLPARFAALIDADTPLEERGAAQLAKTLHLSRGDTPCPPVRAPAALPARVGTLRIALHFRCARGTETAPLQIQNDAFFSLIPGHLHFARFHTEKRTQERLFSFAQRTQSLHTAPGAARVQEETSLGIFERYLSAGIVHILEGFDHLAFLAALLLVCFGRAAIFAITGFTLGHSLTLALAAIGTTEANLPQIEALIGFTILFVALESATARAGFMRGGFLALAGLVAILALVSVFVGGIIGWAGWAGMILFTLAYAHLVRTEEDARRATPILAIVFGLVHGFGFASVLEETGFPDAHLLPALAGFNIGVEIGQLAIALIFLSLAMLPRALGLTPKSVHALQDTLATALAALGGYWLVARGFAA